MIPDRPGEPPAPPRPVEKAAPLVYVVMERDYYPDSVWWTLGEAEARRVELKEKNRGAYHEVLAYRIGDPVWSALAT